MSVPAKMKARLEMETTDRRPRGWLTVNQASEEWSKEAPKLSVVSVNAVISRGRIRAVRVSVYVPAIDETIERVFVHPQKPGDRRHDKKARES